MDFWRRTSNPWGQEVLIGVAWDMLWAAAILGLLFVIGHAVYVRWLAPKAAAMAREESGAHPAIPERIVRHSLGARVFHWLMAAAMFVLLVTAFFPVIGIRFPWVTVHWIAGVALLVTIVYHVVHAVFWQDLRSMLIKGHEVTAGSREVRSFLRRSISSEAKPGKYPLDHKLYHHVISVVTTAAIVTGLLMMVRVDTPFWERNPYLLSDQAWGGVYVVHGISGVALITLVMAHIYFAIRPEKWWITRSMIKGWIRRSEFLAHHDPDRWIVAPSSVTRSGGSGGSGPQDKHPST